MKSFKLLAAILFLTLGSTVWADDPAPADETIPAPAEEPVTLEGEYAPNVTGGAYTDFPGYYPGYSSYRGIGFMGSCCEQNSCCAQHVWDGYCEQRGCGCHSPWHAWKEKLRCHLARPVCCDTGCSQKVCCEEPCVQKGGCEDTCGQKGGYVAKPFHGLCNKLHFGWKRPAYTTKTDCCPEPCCEVKPRHNWLGKLHCGLHQPKCGVDPCCDPCCEQKSDLSCGVETKCQKPLCGKLHGLWRRNGWANGFSARSYGEYYAPFDGKAMPTYAEPMDSDQQIEEPTPEATPETITEPPAEITTDYVPSLPDFTTDDRSALRRLPAVR